MPTWRACDPFPVTDPAQVCYLCDVLLETCLRDNDSAHAYHRILKLTRPIADLGGSDQIAAPHLAEALQYRPRVDVV